MLQGIRPLIQLRQLLIALQHLLHIHPHYAHDLIHLGLCLLEALIARIALPRGGRVARWWWQNGKIVSTTR
uniref:Putative secreted protein n=1 Tax=Lutzomyia longipalpis TaxID=7200 RepID=A0A7G3AGQ4_LUTLO